MAYVCQAPAIYYAIPPGPCFFTVQLDDSIETPHEPIDRQTIISFSFSSDAD